MYVSVACVILVIVNVAVGWTFEILGLVTEQVPTEFVVQVAVPEIPPLHVPVTVAPDTGV